MRRKVTIIALVVAGLAVVFCLPGVRSTLFGLARDRGEEPARERAWYGTGDSYYHRPDCPSLAGKRHVSRPVKEVELMGMHPCPECWAAE